METEFITSMLALEYCRSWLPRHLFIDRLPKGRGRYSRPRQKKRFRLLLQEWELA